MEVTNKVLITPYSQHYLCTYELFGDHKLGLVFQYIFDNYLKSFRMGKSKEGFELNISHISKNLVVSRNTVNKYLDKLEEMELIFVEQKICTVNANYFCSVAKLYSFAKQQMRGEISKAFVKNDIKKLEELGLNTEENLEEAVRNLSSGWIVSNNAPTAQTGAPTAQTGAPTAQTGAPTVQTGAPTVQTGAPTVQTGAPTVQTGAPTVQTDTHALLQMLQTAKTLQNDAGNPLFDPKQVLKLEQLLLKREQLGAQTGAPVINNIIKEKKENTGEALKRDNDDNLERGASSHEFFENSSGTGDNGLPAYTTREELIQQKQKRQQQDEEILFRTYISNRHPEKYDRLPAYQIREIIAKPEYHTSDWEQIVYTLWSEYGNDKETLSCEPEITGKDLMRLVNSVKDDMELGGQSFTLSLEQVFDILAFDVIDDRNRTTFQLDFSKIRDITTPMPETGDDGDEEPSRERKPKRSRFEERRRIADYLDSITETADEDVDSLTAAEYAILQMIDYVEARKQNRETNPDEVTRYIMNSLTKKWAEAADLSEEEISRLFRTIPKRGNIVTLHPERIPVDRILQMNESRKEHSRVAELWEKKQAESRPEESVD